jgi:hypothetical protein
VNKNNPDTLSPKACASKMLELSGSKFASDVAAELWPKILQHKWLMSKKLGRDVGLRTACIDFVENIDQAHKEFVAYKQPDILTEMGAQTVSKEIWDTIYDSQPPKQVVEHRIILPLTVEKLSRKHGVFPPMMEQTNLALICVMSWKKPVNWKKQLFSLTSLKK